jgi:glutamyl-tRNA synthetase
MENIKVRIAPSPTGVPHIGVTRTALFNFLFARHNQGKFILRIEDTDRERLIPESLPQILEILRFLDIVWDEGPYYQSERLSLYQEFAKKLVEQEKAYFCFCTLERLDEVRYAQQKKGLPPKYDRYCLNFSREEVNKKILEGIPNTVRLKIPDKGETSWKDLVHGKITFKNSDLDDHILLKSDGWPTYHLAVVVDDYLMKISHVLRGDEWISSTPKHLILYQALGWQPPEFGHLPIVLGPDKRKLSKRHGAKSVLEYRNEGYLKEALVNFMAFLGWSPPSSAKATKGEKEQEIFSLEELVEKFDIGDINPTSPIFNLEKLQWFNEQWIKKLPDRDLRKRLENFVPKIWDSEVIEELIPSAKERMRTLKDFAKLSGYIFTKKIKVSLRPKEIKILRGFLAEVKKIKIWRAEKLREMSENFAKKIGLSNKELFMSIRKAISGKEVTLPLFESMEILGREEILKRIESAIKQ